MESNVSLWDEFCSIAKRLSLELFGSPVESISFRLSNGERARLPIRTENMVVEGSPAPWHSKDFREVRWPDLGMFHLTPKQSAAVKLLWRAWEDKSGDLPGSVLLRAADSDCVRLVDLFKKSDAWQRLVLSTRRGLYHLPLECQSQAESKV